MDYVFGLKSKQNVIFPLISAWTFSFSATDTLNEQRNHNKIQIKSDFHLRGNRQTRNNYSEQ